jgi:hypothetical protein
MAWWVRALAVDGGVETVAVVGSAA